MSHFIHKICESRGKVLNILMPAEDVCLWKFEVFAIVLWRQSVCD